MLKSIKAMDTKNNHRLKALIIHFKIYLIINIGLILLNLFTLPQHIWFYWPLLGWGGGVIMHSIFGVLIPLKKSVDIQSILNKSKVITEFMF